MSITNRRAEIKGKPVRINARRRKRHLGELPHYGRTAGAASAESIRQNPFGVGWTQEDARARARHLRTSTPQNKSLRKNGNSPADAAAASAKLLPAL